MLQTSIKGNLGKEVKSLSKIIFLAILTVVLLVGVGYIGIKSNSQPAVNANQLNQTNIDSNVQGASSDSEVKTFNIVGAPFSFTPNEIRVKKGDTVKINFTDNEGYHNLIIDGLGIKTQSLRAGQSDTVQFIADKTGSFTYYCGIPGHREKGMTGSLIVE